MNILQVSKYCLVIKVELQNKLSLLILLQEKHLEKQIKVTEEHGQVLQSSRIIRKYDDYDTKNDGT